MDEPDDREDPALPRLRVFYDGGCRRCTRAAELLRRLDRGRRLELLSFRDPRVVEGCRLGPERLARLERRMQVEDPSTGRVREGAAAVEAILRRIPLLWPLLAPWALLRLLGLAGPLYDLLARTRHGLLTGPCREAACPVHRKTRR